MRKLYSLLLFSFVALQSFAQCQPGEVEITVFISLDAWGYENYWEIYPEGELCSTATIISGGNETQVGCDGAGQQDATGGNGYPSNTTVEAGSTCLTIGENYTLQFIDDWGDGGSQFFIYQDGLPAFIFTGGGSGSTWTFTAGDFTIPEYDLPCGAASVEVDGPGTLVNNVGATGQFFEVVPPGDNCQLPGLWCETGIDNSVWLTFEAPAAGSYEIATCNSGTNFDTQLAVWSSDDCLDFSSFTLAASNDDIAGGCDGGAFYSSRCYVSCVEAGQVFYIQVDGWNGAEGDAEITVSTYEDAVSMSAQVNSMACAVDKGEPGTGSINAYLVGAGVDFEVSWSGPGSFSADTSNINDLEVGTYMCTATTACGDEITQSFEITMPAFLSLSMTITQPDCPMSADGIAQAAGIGGTAPYEYEWTGPDGYTSDLGTVNDLNEGQYNLLMTDDNGCEYNQQINLTALNDLPLDLGSDVELCQNYGETLLLSAPAGYIYTWQDGSQNQFYFVDSETLDLGEYSFILNMESDEGCSAIDAVVVSVEICDGVEDEDFDSPSLFPNPTADMVTISGLIDNSRIDVYDASGRLLETMNCWSTSHIIYMQNHAQGIYFVHVEVAEKTFVYRLAKQ
ncbi:MAG: T9SS type A sorting domain-containing protein [Cryomorphaceae bacterium]|nr:T9SS type A sorting domain-containing protein [Cryomorphaceae bacterium]